MEINESKECIELLRNEETSEWIDKIRCWVKKENNYNIYIFQVNVEDEEELEQLYNPISASIALEFQSKLKKNIEKWNIYLIYIVKKEISIVCRKKIEQDKYGTRKFVWDKLKNSDIQSIQVYINERLFKVKVEKQKLASIDEQKSIKDMIKESYKEIHNILDNNELDDEKKVQIYLGGDKNE